MWRLAGPEPTLDANNHQIAHHFAGDAGGRGRPGDDFPIASVDGEQDPEELAIAASELEMIGAPTDIRVLFTIDACDREVIAWSATTAGISGEMVRDLMIVCVERRFWTSKTPHVVEWLSDNGSAYIVKDTLDTATALGLQALLHPGPLAGIQWNRRGLRQNLQTRLCSIVDLA